LDNANITIPLDQLQRRFQSVATRLPVIAGNEVVNFALDNFKRQGFLGNSFQPWKARKNPTKWGQKPKRNGRAILIDTGRLRRSIRIVRSNWDEVVVGSDVPYAKAHNEGVRLGEIQQVKSFTRKVTTLGVVKTVARKNSTGIKFGRKETGTTTVAAHTRRINQNIPARPFLANSPYLNLRLQRIVAAEIMKAFKQ
jgi:phage gpG-like protein